MAHWTVVVLVKLIYLLISSISDCTIRGCFKTPFKRRFNSLKAQYAHLCLHTIKMLIETAI